MPTLDYDESRSSPRRTWASKSPGQVAALAHKRLEQTRTPGLLQGLDLDKVIEPKIPSRHTTRQSVNGRDYRYYDQKWHPIDEYTGKRRWGVKREAQRRKSIDEEEDDEEDEEIDSDDIGSSSGEDIEELKYIEPVGERHSSRIASTQSRPNYSAKVHPQDQLLRKSGIGTWGSKKSKRSKRTISPKPRKRMKEIDIDEDEEEAINGVSSAKATLDYVQVPAFDSREVAQPVSYSQPTTTTKEVSVPAMSSTQPARTPAPINKTLTTHVALFKIINDSENEDEDDEDFEDAMEEFGEQFSPQAGIASSFSAGQPRSDLPDNPHQQAQDDSHQTSIIISSDHSSDSSVEDENEVDLSGQTAVNSSSPVIGEGVPNEFDRATLENLKSMLTPATSFKKIDARTEDEPHEGQDKENASPFPTRHIDDEV